MCDVSNHIRKGKGRHRCEGVRRKDSGSAEDIISLTVANGISRHQLSAWRARCCPTATSERRHIRTRADYHYIALREASIRRSMWDNALTAKHDYLRHPYAPRTTLFRFQSPILPFQISSKNQYSNFNRINISYILFLEIFKTVLTNPSHTVYNATCDKFGLGLP